MAELVRPKSKKKKDKRKHRPEFEASDDCSSQLTDQKLSVVESLTDLNLPDVPEDSLTHLNEDAEGSAVEEQDCDEETGTKHEETGTKPREEETKDITHSGEVIETQIDEHHQGPNANEEVKEEEKQSNIQECVSMDTVEEDVNATEESGAKSPGGNTIESKESWHSAEEDANIDQETKVGDEKKDVEQGQFCRFRDLSQDQLSSVVSDKNDKERKVSTKEDATSLEFKEEDTLDEMHGQANPETLDEAIIRNKETYLHCQLKEEDEQEPETQHDHDESYQEAEVTNVEKDVERQVEAVSDTEVVKMIEEPREIAATPTPSRPG